MRPWAWACAGLLALLLPSCKNDLHRVAAIMVPANAPDRVTTNAEYYYSDSGRVRNRIMAGTISEYTNEDAPHTDLTNGVELDFFDTAGILSSKLTSRRGQILPKQQRMEVEEQVVFTNAKGEKLETEQLTWDQDSDRVFTDQPVKVTRVNDIIYGQGLDASQDFSRYTIRHITGSLFLDRSDTLAPTKDR